MVMEVCQNDITLLENSDSVEFQPQIKYITTPFVKYFGNYFFNNLTLRD